MDVALIDQTSLIRQFQLSRGPALRRLPGAEDEEEPDSHFEWVSPDEATRRPFERSQEAAVALARQYDLCLGGEALHHIHQIGAAPLFVPLTQASGFNNSLF